MKKFIFMMVALLICSLSVEAQRPQRPARMNPEEMMQKRTEQMVKKYNLNEEQATKLLALNKGQIEKMKAIRPNPLPKDSLQAMSKDARKAYKKEMKEKQESMREVQKNMETEYQTALKEILTTEQFEQYQKDEQARMEQRNARRNRGFDGPRRGPRENGFDDDF